MAKGKKRAESQTEPATPRNLDLPQRPKVHTPDLLKAYRTVASSDSLPEDSDALVKMVWKLKEEDAKSFIESLNRQEVAFKKAWNDEKLRLDGLKEKKRQEERATEARKLEAESEARRDAPPAELVDAAGPTLVLIDRVLGEYAT